MRIRTLLPLLFALAPVAASAQTLDGGAAPTEVAMLAARECGVQPTFVSVERGMDKVLRYQLSPTLSEAELGCIVNALGARGVIERKK